MDPLSKIYPEPPFVLLEDSLNPDKALLLFEAPHQLITAHKIEEIELAFNAIEKALKEGHHVAGFMTYELGLALEPKLQKRLSTPCPLIWFGVFKDKLEISHQEFNEWLAEEKNKTGFGHKNKPGSKEISILTEEKFSDYEKKFRAVKSAIEAGDIYQLNLTFKAKVENAENPLELYQRMRNAQPVSFASLIMTGETTILSASPELFIENKSGWLETRPMKGTLKRAPTWGEDQNHQQSLQEDEKSRAENLMIVDLMRNDLSRISETGTVSVDELFKIETYHSLHQMISIVRAKLKQNLTLIDQMKALFPPGSITGAPKIRAMELIDELERAPRGLYTGSIGYFAPNEDYCFNVAIRTIELNHEGQGQMGIGSGLVYDSKARDEYDECLLKLEFLKKDRPEFSLLETMAYIPDRGILYKKEHCNRLAQSAQYFHIPFCQDEFDDLLNRFIQNSTSPLRLRVLLNKAGTISITPTPLEFPTEEEIWPIIWADKPMNSKNIYLYHKTTHRHFYDDVRTRLQKKQATIKEVIFLNEYGEVTEGSFTNLFIKENDKLITPPVSAGLLPGTLRQNLLEHGDAIERRLTMQDVERANELFVGNSVRGLIRAKLVG